MIIPFINQKKLAVVPSQDESKRITNILEQNKIEYYIKTQRVSGNNITAAMSVKDIAHTTGYGGSAYDSNISFVYTIYVKRRDFASAKNLTTTSFDT